MPARTDREILLKQLLDKEVSLAGDVTLDDTNIATTATKTTAIATSAATSATQNTTAATKLTTMESQQFGGAGILMQTSEDEAIAVEANTYYAVQMINSTTFSTFTGTGCTGTLTTTYPAGCILYIDVLSLAISAGGPVALYKN